MLDAGPPLRAAAALGPYFVWEPWDGSPGWRPLGDLCDPVVAAQRVDTGRRVLLRMSGLTADDVPERVAASIVFLGLASRLLSPLLGAAAIGGALPVPAIDRLWWRPVESGPLPIAWHGFGAVRFDAATLTATATRGLIEPILEVFRQRFSLSPRVLWGNVVSALGGAAGMIAGNAPAHAGRAAAIVEAVLAVPPLRGTATFERPGPDRDRWVLTRRNCCLYYRIPGGGTCGDCVLGTRRRR